MNKMELYYKLPVFFQNIIVSIYGWKRNVRRYHGSFKKYFKEVSKSEYFDTDGIRDYQKNALKNLLLFANKSEHYSKVFKSLGIDVDKDDPFDILKMMPILSKNELRGNEEKFFTGKRKGDQVFHTSGSTGTPLSIVMGLDDFRLRMAVLERIKHRFGISHRDKHITFVGKRITKNNDHIFWRKNIPGNQLVMSVYDISNKNKNKYLKKIVSYRPKLIEGYPSALSVIAQWALEEKVIIRPKAVFATAETLTIEQKKIIEKAFLCPVINYYGSTEGAPIISPCKNGNLHLDFETGIIEFLDLDNQPAKIGDIARMVVTCFTTTSMPLIRYDIGDLAVLSNKNCNCRSSMPVIDEIVGRQDDVFETPDKGYVGRLSTSLKLFPSIVKRSQIQQLSPTDFLLLIQSEVRISESELNNVLDDLYNKLGNVNIKVEYVNEIPLGKNGKFRTQIRKY